MSNIDDIFKRLDIRQIREFLLNGMECTEISSKDCEQRLDKALKPVIEMLDKITDENEQEKAAEDIFDYGATIQEVYMEIGIQCGASLMAQLLNKQCAAPTTMC